MLSVCNWAAIVALDINGPFDKKWRDGDSRWAEATDEELKGGLDKLASMSHQVRIRA